MDTTTPDAQSGYNDDFYKLYADYLEEPTVRAAHGWIFAIAGENSDFDRVIDFGCGRHCEFREHFRPTSYLGIDVNADEQQAYTLQSDYRALDLTTKFNQEFFGYYDSFVSLFSSEITDWIWMNVAFYDRVFDCLPNIKSALVSGFYYSDQLHKGTVHEAGDIISYQSVDRPHCMKGRHFSVKEIVLPVPSKLFGDKVWEVWRFLERKERVE